MQGVELFRKDFVETKEVIDISLFPNGVYVVSIFNNNNPSSVKLIKQ